APAMPAATRRDRSTGCAPGPAWPSAGLGDRRPRVTLERREALLQRRDDGSLTARTDELDRGADLRAHRPLAELAVREEAFGVIGREGRHDVRAVRPVALVHAL